jgi:MFS family permease
VGPRTFKQDASACPMHKMQVRSESSWRYPGWRVVAVCHLGVLTGFATVFIYSFSLMVKPLQHEFGWNREQVSRAFSLAAISVAICSPFMGRLFDRYEPRKIIACFMAALGIGLASLAWLRPHLAQLYATAIFIGIAGTGTYQLGYARVVASWFERRLGGALSMLVAGSGVGSLLLPPLVQHLIARNGWRHTYQLLALLPLLIGAPLTMLYARTLRTDRPRPFPFLAPPALTEGATWREAISGRSFWLLALGICFVSLCGNGALAHLSPMLSDRGLKLGEAALVVSILGGSSLAGRLLLGWLLDYFEGSYIATFSLLSAGWGIFLLAHAPTFRSAAVAALIAGLGMGCELDLIPYMLKRYFGLRSLSTLYGLIYCVFAAAGAIAPLLLGHMYDISGSYTAILSILAGATMAVSFAMLALPAYSRTDSIHGAAKLPRLVTSEPEPAISPALE